MKLITENKGMIFAVLVLILVIFLYNSFVKPNVSSVSTAAATSVGEDLLKMSRELKAVQLNVAIFSNPEYRFLVDFTAPIAQDPLGRPNPFNVLGRD